jgi:hypothetical protein
LATIDRGRFRTALAAALSFALALAVSGAALGQDASAEEMPAQGTLLEPGRYVSDAVGPTIDFRVGEGWVAGAAPSGPIFTLERADQPGTVLTVTRFDGAVFVESCDATSLTDVEITVPRLAEIIAGNPFLNPAPPEVTDVDGYIGFNLDVATPAFDDCALPYLLLWALPMQDGEFVQVSGQQSRFVIVDVEGDVIVIAIESFPGVPFGSLLEKGMDVVESMRIEPGDYVPPSPSPVPVPNPEPSNDPVPSEPPASAAPVIPDEDEAA